MAIDSASLSQALTGPLYLGCRGDGVKRVQSRLNTLIPASQLTADGAFGAKTDKAVRAFQSQNQLTADGIVGPMTAAKLGFTNYQRSAPPPQPQRPPRPSQIPGNALPPQPQSGGSGGAGAGGASASPLSQLADSVAEQINLAAHEIANAFQAIAALAGDDVAPACRSLIVDSAALARDTRSGIINAVLAGNPQGVAQTLRNAKQRGMSIVERFLDLVKDVGLVMRSVVAMIASRVRTIMSVVFDGAINVALGVGGTVASYVREAAGTIYSGVSSVINTARQLIS